MTYVIQMGWDIALIGEDGVVMVERHTEGGIIAIGGTSQAEMSVTYNYSPFYYDVIDKEEGFRWLNLKKAKDVIKRLEDAVERLGTEQDENYWEATSGNAGHILSVMLGWSKQHPNAVWEVE